jgi:hypothetical protein
MMISALFLLSILWFGLVLDDEFSLSRGDFLLRLAAAIVLGCFLGTWLVYLLALAFGFDVGVIIGATGLIFLANGFAWKKRRRDLAWFASLFTFRREFWRTFGFIVALVTAFFLFGFWRNRNGDIVFHGNFIDLAFHMSTASAFLEQGVFPPLNPQSAAAKMSYHFMTDFFAAILCRGGFPILGAYKVAMSLFAFSLGSLLCFFFSSVLKRRVAALCGCILFFFGHVGVFHFLFGLAGYPLGNEPFSLKSWTSIYDHLTYPYFNFLNVLVNFFEPQLPFLFGLPFALLILLYLFRRVTSHERSPKTICFVIILVGLLPLFHLHSFLVLAPLVGLVILSEKLIPSAGPESLPTSTGESPRAGPDSTRRSRLTAALPVVFAIVLAGLAILPQFLFLLSQKKIQGYTSFDVAAKLGSLREIPDLFHLQRVWYWVRAAGMPFVLGVLGFFTLAEFRFWRKRPEQRAENALLVFFALGTVYFIFINFCRLTPNWGDSNKLFLYWNLGLCIYAGQLLFRLWQRSPLLKFSVALLLVFGGILPFAVEWGTRLSRGPIVLFPAGDQITAEWIRLNTPPDAVFLTANSLAHFVPALAGRRVVNGSYTRETGFADAAIEESVARAFREADPALITTVGVTYIVVGPEEKNIYRISRGAMARWHRLVFEQTSRDQRYSVYAVQHVPPNAVAEERAREKPEGFDWLSWLEPSYVKQFGILKFDESFDTEFLELGGAAYPTGLGTHAPSEIRFPLDGKYTMFESEIGVDGSQHGGPASVIFRVGVDDRIVYTSRVFYAGTPPEKIAIDVTGANTLTLWVGDAGDGIQCDHADWAGAKLVKAKQK